MSEVRVELKKRTVWLGDQKYWYKSKFVDYPENEKKVRTWYRESTTTARGEDGDTCPIEIAEKNDPCGDGWAPAPVRIKNPNTRKKLNRAVDEAKAKERRTLKRLLEPFMKRSVIENRSDYEANLFCQGKLWKRTKHPGVAPKWEKTEWVDDEPDYVRVSDRRAKILEKVYKSSDHVKIPRFLRLDSEAEEVHKEHQGKSSDASKSKIQAGSETGGRVESKAASAVKRTKWGTRIYSNDNVHYFNVGVWTSKKYPGCTTVRISVAGKHFVYTLSEKYIDALQAEISRGMPT